MRIPKGSVTPEDLCTARLEYLAKNPGASDIVLTHILNLFTVIEIMGIAWAQKNIAANRPASQTYFPRLNADEDENYRWQHRLTQLAMVLYEGQHIPGFADVLGELRTRGLRGVTAELLVAHLLHTSGRQPRFIPRSKEKTADLAALVDEQSVTVEVKAKTDATPLTSGTIVSTLRDARRQLSPEGPGVVVLAIPAAWTSGISVNAQVVDGVQTALRSTGRINAVVLMWEAVLPVVPNGRAFATVCGSIMQSNPRTPVAEISGLVAAIAPERLLLASRPTHLRDAGM